MSEKTQSDRNADHSFSLEYRQPDGSIIYYMPISISSLALNGPIPNCHPFMPNASAPLFHTRHIKSDWRSDLNIFKQTDRKSSKEPQKKYLSRLCDEIEELYELVKPSENDFKEREELFNRIKNILENVFQGIQRS